MNRVDAHGLKIAHRAVRFHRQEATPKTRDFARRILGRLAAIIAKIGAEKNRELLAVRDALQPRSTAGTAPTRARCFDMNAYTAFLRRSAICSRSPRTHQVETSDVDEEIGTICGPQLVVPLTNARYALTRGQRPLGQPV